MLGLRGDSPWHRLLGGLEGSGETGCQSWCWEMSVSCPLPPSPPPPELPSVHLRCAENTPGLSARLGASSEPGGAGGSGQRYLLRGMAGLYGWAPCLGLPFMATSAGRVRGAAAPASITQGASSSYGREMMRMRRSPRPAPHVLAPHHPRQPWCRLPCWRLGLLGN